MSLRFAFMLVSAIASLSVCGQVSAYTNESEVSYNTKDTTLTGHSKTIAEEGDLRYARACVRWIFGYDYWPYCSIVYEWYTRASVVGSLHRQSQSQAVQSSYVRHPQEAKTSISVAAPAGDTWSARGHHYRELDHYVYYCGPAYCYAGGYAGTTRRLLETTSESEVVCGVPEVDIMIREYEAPAYSRTDFKPSCNSFQSAGASRHFTWSQLNGGFADGNPHRPWGIVTDSLRRGLDYIASNYPNFKGIRLTSGYRCPHGNASPTVRGSNTSFHMIGRAADLLRNGWTEEEYEAVKAIAQEVGGTAMLPYSRYRDRHLHMHF